MPNQPIPELPQSQSQGWIEKLESRQPLFCRFNRLCEREMSASLRQRKPLVVPEESIHPLFDRPIFKRFSKLDIYPKTASEVQKKTQVGGAGIHARFGLCVSRSCTSLRPSHFPISLAIQPKLHVTTAAETTHIICNDHSWSHDMTYMFPSLRMMPSQCSSFQPDTSPNLMCERGGHRIPRL